eukprot:gb/GFBE01068132.1/.p2 GENE.gb/GFBE01068132.1/~~gb/GFBE01068132.1/.p2  ORF type:complete len:104 (+),score=20.33 gb/GFBE01068132.1/:480-791(+)
MEFTDVANTPQLLESCAARKAAGYNSGMGAIFAKVANITRITSQSHWDGTSPNATGESGHHAHDHTNDSASIASSLQGSASLAFSTFVPLGVRLVAGFALEIL